MSTNVRGRSKIVSIVWGVLASIGLICKCQNVTAENVDGFQVFDATAYGSKPGLTKYGIQPIRVIYGQEIWDDVRNMDPLPSHSKVRGLARQLAINNRIVVLDVEHWPVKPTDGDVADGMSKLLTLFRWFKDGAPSVQVGYYSLLPIRDYWRAIKPKDHPERIKWQSENDNLVPLADSVDALFPSLYTFYDDKAGWVRYAEAQIAEARRIGGNKPVYVFLWPQYHDSTPLGLTYIDPEFWRLELEIAKAHADGIVIWGGWDFAKKARAEWDESAAWWQVTKQFLHDNELIPNTNAP